MPKGRIVDNYTRRRRQELRVRCFSYTSQPQLARRREDALAILADPPVSTRRRKAYQWTPEQDAALCRAIAAGVPSDGLAEAIREHRVTTEAGCRERFQVLRSRLRRAGR